ncbi:MAG: serine hydrolase [Proteobacteria bacterium]|nr:serine hydrolase [Pseudomonadota bacterium]
MKKFLIPFFTLLSVCGNSLLSAQTETPPQIEKFIQELEVQKNELQGGAIAIFYKGQVVYKSTFGKQNGNSGKITSSTLFPLASVSKVVSATSIALMVDKGLLNFNEKFKVPCLKNPVSLSNILSHTTGYQFSGNAEVEQGMSRAKLLNTIQKQQPKGKPGQFYRYSNTMFSLVEEALNAKDLSLSIAIEKLSADLNTQGLQVLPIPMNVEVAYPHSKTTVDGVETMTPLPFPPYYPKTVPASAGVFASLDSMIELFKLCFGYRPDLISQKTLDVMFTPIKSNDDCFKWNLGKPVDKKNIESLYALGWRILSPKKDPAKKLIFHSGYINGIGSFIGFIPSAEIGIIFLSNQRTPIPVKSGIKFWGKFLR